jgi:hypothetical protein
MHVANAIQSNRKASKNAEMNEENVFEKFKAFLKALFYNI